MTASQLSHREREEVARTALGRLGTDRHAAVRVHVDCSHSHHLATVVATSDGLVYEAAVHGRSHGRRDREDTPHRPHDEARYVDLLEPADEAMADDHLPAWCDCGQRSLSRAALIAWTTAGKRRVVVT